MEKVILKQSTKDIPVPNNVKYCQELIHSIDKFISNARQRAFFFLNPDKRPANKKNCFGFKSLKCGPAVKELKEFEDEIFEMAAKVEFGTYTSDFQKDMDKLVERIEKDEKEAKKSQPTH